MTTITTLGHSRHELDHLLGLLQEQGIQRLADVRSQPYSKWAPQYRREPLARSLEAAGIEYVFLGQALGGRWTSGEASYEERRCAPDFVAGLEELTRLADERPTAILCAEEDPRRCHRRLLITPALVQRAVEVVHLRGDGRLESEARLGGEGTPLLPFE